MPRSIFMVLLITIAAAPATTSNTGWLESSHQQVKLLVEHTRRDDCGIDCDRYVLVLSYRTAAQQDRDVNTFSEANCVDVASGGRKWFACRLPGALAGTTKEGQRFATMRFRVKSAQLETLGNEATVTINTIRVTLPQDTRAAIVDFVRRTAVPAVISGDRQVH